MNTDGRVYYNEFDDAAATWIENLIADGELPPGVVDRRSISDVDPADLVGFTQCHFFAGIGGWALAARLARWPASAGLWSGSCPCQPFSAAGKRQGLDDHRHLWPDFFRLIRARRPARVVGEQVAGAAGFGWFDGVLADLESAGYAGRAVDIPALAVNRPHQRQRIYWVAVRGEVGLADLESVERGPGLRQAGPVGDGDIFANGDGARGDPTVGQADGLRAGPGAVGRDARGPDGAAERAGRPDVDAALSGGRDAAAFGDVADAVGSQRRRRADMPRWGSKRGAPAIGDDHGQRGGVDLVDASSVGRGERREGPDVHGRRGAAPGPDARVSGEHGVTQGDAVGAGLEGHGRHDGGAGGRTVAGGYASASDGGEPTAGVWITCHDGKARRIPYAGFPMLADGISGRVAVRRSILERADPIEGEEIRHVSRIAAWRGFGNAIVPDLAAEVLAALLETVGTDG